MLLTTVYMILVYIAVRDYTLIEVKAGICVRERWLTESSATP